MPYALPTGPDKEAELPHDRYKDSFQHLYDLRVSLYWLFVMLPSGGGIND
jgi:hypothetical protein